MKTPVLPCHAVDLDESRDIGLRCKFKAATVGSAEWGIYVIRPKLRVFSSIRGNRIVFYQTIDNVCGWMLA